VSDETVVESDGVTVSKFFNGEDFPVPAVAFDVSSSRDSPWNCESSTRYPKSSASTRSASTPSTGARTGPPAATASSASSARSRPARRSPPSTASAWRTARTRHRSSPRRPSRSTAKTSTTSSRPSPPTSSANSRAASATPSPASRTTRNWKPRSPRVPAASTPLDDDAEILEGDIDLGSDDAADAAADSDADADKDFLDADDEDPDPVEAGEELDPVDGGEDDESDVGLPDPDAPSETAIGADADPVTETASLDEEPPAAIGFDAGDVAGALAEAIRQDEVSDEDMETLDEAFGGISGSTEVEIEHVQSRVSELEAYTDALEAFLDDNGPAQDLLAELEADVGSLRGPR